MKKIVLTTVLAIATLFSAQAQVGALDATFNSGGSGVNDAIYATAIQPDGKILIGGQFTTFNGQQASGIIRLNIDGTIDNTFNSGTGIGFGFYVYRILIQPDNKIIIAGMMSSYNGSPMSMIGRLNSDGTIDNTFLAPSTNANAIFAAALQSDGKIVIGGDFTNYGGNNRIARLNADGTIDATFNTGTGCNSAVRAIAIQSDGKIVVGGGFTSFNGNALGGLVRLNTNGSYQSNLQTLNGIVYDIAMQGTGVNESIIIAGAFSNAGALPVGKIARLTLGGNVEATFHTNIGTGFGQSINQIAVNPDNGEIVVAGYFWTFKGNNIPYGLTRLSADGVRETTFNSGGTGANENIFAVAIQPNGQILIGGNFTQYNGTNKGRLARINGACLVNIPDANFKAYLVGNSAINTNGDSEIQCSEAQAFTGAIYCGNMNIADLTGIEAFTAITEITCANNQLTSLDISNNTALSILNCSNNQLTSLNLGANTVITLLNCLGNQLTSLNLSQNTGLEQVSCLGNQLTSLDFSANTALKQLSCINNSSLTSLNVANGNNHNFTGLYAYSTGLTCIKVDNAAYSTANWTGSDFQFPAGITFSETCQAPPTAPNAPSNLVATLAGADVNLSWQDNSTDEDGFEVYAPQSLGDTSGAWNQMFVLGANVTTATHVTTIDGLYCYKVRAFKGSLYSAFTEVECVEKVTTGINELASQNAISIYPNPANGQINFSIPANVQVTNAIGQVIANKRNVSTLDLSNQATGIYFLTLTNNNGQVIQRSKIVKE